MPYHNVLIALKAVELKEKEENKNTRSPVLFLLFFLLLLFVRGGRSTYSG